MAVGAEAGVVDVEDEAMTCTQDRVGLGWRPDLAAAILENLDGIDLIEVIADDFFGTPSISLLSVQAAWRLAISLPRHGHPRTSRARRPILVEQFPSSAASL